MSANAAPVDPLTQFSLALAAPADSKEQAELLSTLRESLENHPSLSILCSTLINTLSGTGDSLMKTWVLNLLHFAICKSNLSAEARTQLADQSLEVLAGLLNDGNINTLKVVVQCFPTVYALLFRSLCVNRSNRKPWDILTQAKARILEFVWAPHVNAGLRISAVKFMQRVILVQTRGINDPRLQNKDDPNLNMVPSDHPFISVQALEQEGLKLLEGVITTLYTSNNPDMLSAILNSWANLIKRRPALVELVVSTLVQWTPVKLEGQPASVIRSAEKTIRILLTHISRTPQGHPFVGQIQSALAAQAARMEQAVAEEKARRAAAAEASKKRTTTATPVTEAPESKRPKLEHEPVPALGAGGFDFSALPATLVTDLIVANLQAHTENALIGLVQAYRHKKATTSIPVPAVAEIPGLSSTPPPSRGSTAEHVASVSAQRPPPSGPRADREKKAKSVTPPPPPAPVKIEEPVDPLKMDIDDEEMEYEPDRLNLEISGEAEPIDEAEAALDHAMEEAELPITDFKLPPARELDADDREVLMRKAITRIREGAKELVAAEGALDASDPHHLRTTPADMWMLLLVRMVTRVSDPSIEQEANEDETKADDAVVKRSEIYDRQDRLRHALCEYIMADFSGRIRLATTWMNEEWYNDRIRRQQDRAWQPNYETWLNQIVAAYQTHAEGKDRTFSRFLLDLPAVPQDVLNLLRESCVEPERRQMGFAALREFVSQRPSLRAEAMNMLLELTTHPDKITRGAAINTVKRWIPDVQPMADMIRDFALQLLRRLQSRPKQAEEEKPEKPQTNGADHEENMEDGQLPQEDIIQTPYLPEQLELPAVNAQILQHVELLFALSTKVPEFLDEIFAAYGGMEETVQETVQQLITPLVRALGPTHGKLLTLLRTFPPGAESLALRVLTIFTETGRPSAQLVALVKSLVNERDLDARFLIPIIAEMDKADIVRHLPRIVSILNGTPEPKQLVRSVFSSIVTTPPETFGKVTSNLPRVRQSELLTPAELMVLLHESEREIGLRSAIEAISICFSMTDIYRSEILGVVMNQLVDVPNLPTLFMRTVIQAVTTYRSLRGFVSTTLLSRLITKKIWTNPPLWEGFIRCAKLIAPQSFGALLQLPKEQLREVVEKQPTLKAELREHVMKKGTNKARVAGYLDIFGEDDSSTPAAAASPAPSAGESTPQPEPEPLLVEPAQSS
ncbi:Symplekin tight junction protein C terminal-domain-containing protein [Dichomitus squalens]|uniref:Symplekin tight junction protein C terminal-domain-containing protein n=1 Tax=Dichomitus squalens TaxID=114155 RepID=A0A4Q9MVZ7_9APHY|nr:Symplekin tight junction protein C terminal-domain-containing protein [Dichomitus squalens]